MTENKVALTPEEEAANAAKDAAYNEGSNAYADDKSLDDNPHIAAEADASLRTAWQDGWEDAAEDDDGTCGDCDNHMEDCTCPDEGDAGDEE